MCDVFLVVYVSLFIADIFKIFYYLKIHRAT